MLPSNTSAAEPTDSCRVGCAWMVSAMSSASQPISIAGADFTQQLTAVSTDNCTTDHTVRFFVENQLGHTVCAVGSDSATRSSPREGGGFVADAFLFRFFLSQTYPCNFWFGIGDGRDNFRIEVMFLPAITSAAT